MNVLTVDVATRASRYARRRTEGVAEVSFGAAAHAQGNGRRRQEAGPGWKYDAVSIGYPGPVIHGRPVSTRATHRSKALDVAGALPGPQQWLRSKPTFGLAPRTLDAYGRGLAGYLAVSFGRGSIR